MFIPRRILQEKLLRFLEEDIGMGDITSTCAVPRGLQAKAVVIVKADGIVAGIEEAKILTEAVGLEAKAKVKDGAKVKTAQVLLTVSGDAEAILVIERTMLNLLSRMSGIATATHALVEKIGKANLKTRVAATRKAAPGLLFFDKKAVAIGGGDPHRLHLDDLILIKDNHIALAGNLEKAVRLAKQKASFSKKIEVEVTSPADALLAAKLSVDIVMLDNFSPSQVKEVVALMEKSGFTGKVLLEASGGIKSENLLNYAVAGADLVSLGEITNSAKALDMSLEILKPP